MTHRQRLPHSILLGSMLSFSHECVLQTPSGNDANPESDTWHLGIGSVVDNLCYHFSASSSTSVLTSSSPSTVANFPSGVLAPRQATVVSLETMMKLALGRTAL